MNLTNPMSDPLVQRLSFDLNEAKEMLNDRKKVIDDLTAENRELRDKYEKLLKDNMEMAERYLSIVEKIKSIST